MISSLRPSKLLLTIAFSLIALVLVFQLERLKPYYNSLVKDPIDLAPSSTSTSKNSPISTIQKPASPTPTLDHISEPPKPNPPPSGLASLPADYLVVEQDEEWCRKNYGPQYLNYIANRHVPYCEADSVSTMECFHDNGGSDYCLAKGVKFNVDTENGYDLSLNCKLRNFTLERTFDSEKAKFYKYIKNIDEFTDEWYGTGAGPALSSWDISPKPGDTSCTAQNNDGMYYLYIHREDGSNIWHKLMELWQAMVTIDTLQMAIDPSTNLPYLAASDVPNVQVVFTDNETNPLDDIWGVITGSPAIRVTELTSRCMDNVILPLAGSSSPFWKAHWENKDCTSRFLLDAFIRRIYKYLDIDPQQRRQHAELSSEKGEKEEEKAEQEVKAVVTIINRTHNRIILHLPAYVTRLRQLLPNTTIQVIDLASLTLREQILLMQSTDVLVGVVGAGLTHILFLSRSSSVAEISPPSITYTGFRNLSKMRQLPYFTLHGQGEAEWNATVASAEAGELRDLAFGNEEVGAAAVVDREFEGGHKGDWQSADIWLTFDEFKSLVVAAVNAQGAKGLRNMDVVTGIERTKIDNADEVNGKGE